MLRFSLFFNLFSLKKPSTILSDGFGQSQIKTKNTLILYIDNNELNTNLKQYTNINSILKKKNKKHLYTILRYCLTVMPLGFVAIFNRASAPYRTASIAWLKQSTGSLVVIPSFVTFHL